jgi:phosphohistidine phosphatase
MILVLMRHGKAEGPHPQGDKARRLVPQGHRRNKSAAGYLKDQGLSFDNYITSPLVRAQQTAEDVHSVVGGKKAILISPSVTPFGDKVALLAELDVLIKEGVERVLVASHNPFLSEVLQSWFPREEGFSTSSLAGLDYQGSAKTPQLLFRQDFP